MNDAELEFEKEKLRVKYQFRERVAMALIAAAATFLTGIFNYYTVTGGASEVKTATIRAAAEVKKELVATNERHEEKLDTVLTGVDANVKAWKAFDSKDPSDMNVAKEAVLKAEAMTERPAQAASK